MPSHILRKACHRLGIFHKAQRGDHFVRVLISVDLQLAGGLHDDFLQVRRNIPVDFGGRHHGFVHVLYSNRNGQLLRIQTPWKLETILEEKKQIIRKSGLLEYYPASETFADVGDALQQVAVAGLSFPDPELPDELEAPRAFAQFRDQLYKKKWVAYCKEPFAGPEQVFRYLGRYTHRVGLSNHRLLALSDGATVRATE